MNILLSDDAVIQEIEAYPDPNWIWVNIWEFSQYEARLVISVNKEETFRLGTHKVVDVCLVRTEEEDVDKLKKYGRRLTRRLRKIFPDSEVHSDLHY